MEAIISPIEQGIKKIGVGKRTTKVCEPELVKSILHDLNDGSVDSIQKTTFLTALKIKGADEDEIKIANHFGEDFTNDSQFINSVDSTLPTPLFKMTLRLLDKQNLTTAESVELGDYLFSDSISNEIKALIAVVLRMRYTELDEYDGLLQSITKTFNPVFLSDDSPPKTIQISEPFDGYKRGYILSPIVSHYLKNQGYSPIINSGNSSGPKFGITPKTILKHLPFNVLSKASDLKGDPGHFGHMFLQEDLSSALTNWQGIRKKMLKRPFLATLEKYVNPFKADMLICSSFHDTFHDKGLDIAKRAGFNKCINIIKGLEGGLGLSLKRKTKATMYTKSGDKFIESEHEFTPEDFGLTSINDQIIKPLNESDNARLIEEFVKNDYNSTNEYFNLRAKYTLEVFNKLISIAYTN